jgi:hypothetical protein
VTSQEPATEGLLLISDCQGQCFYPSMSFPSSSTSTSEFSFNSFYIFSFDIRFASKKSWNTALPYCHYLHLPSMTISLVLPNITCKSTKTSFLRCLYQSLFVYFHASLGCSLTLTPPLSSSEFLVSFRQHVHYFLPVTFLKPEAPGFSVLAMDSTTTALPLQWLSNQVLLM